METWGKKVGRLKEKKKKRRREKIREEEGSEERRCRCAKRNKIANHYVFSNGLWLRRVEK
jgi:hypothetical protein